MFKTILKSLICFATVFACVSCDNEDIYLGGADESILHSPDGNIVYLADANGGNGVSFVEFKDAYTLNLYLRSSKNIDGNASVTVSYDLSVLSEYNSVNGTDYPAFPAENVSIPDGGVITIESGKISSEAFALGFSAGDDLEPATIYAVPLKVTPRNAAMVSGNESYIILVQDCSKFPGAEKFFNGKPGMKIIGVMEVNDVNPLNTMGFTLKDSGKQFFDIVVLFSANINYNAQTGRVYVSRNENVQALLDQREKYLKPLQRRGIKVVLGILGNHDISGISTLSPELSANFAKEVKDLCDAYELDGVFLDDEYTDYGAAASGAVHGFQAQSTEAASRMAYDIHKAQPSRLMISYRYGALYSARAIDGVEPGQFFDYVCNDYGVSSNPATSYPGLKIGQAATGSWNCSSDSQFIPSNPNWTSRFSLSGMRDSGYGALMIFNFTCDPNYFMTPYIIQDMQTTCQDFWNADLEYDESWYPKDY